MSDLPEILLGAISKDHLELMNTVWCGEHQKYEEKTHREQGCTPGGFTEGTTSGNTCSVTCPDDCTVGGDTCDGGLEACVHEQKKRKAAFQPTIPGWSAPPPELRAR